MSEMSEALPVQESPLDPFPYGSRMVWARDEHGQLVQTEQPLTYEEALHPEEGDRPVSHTAHDTDVSYLREVLQEISDSREHTRVLREVRVDWGVPGLKAHLPDVVLFTEEQHRESRPIGTYRPKEVGAKPLVVIEVTSPSTRGHDLTTKVNQYHRAGVQFYAIVDYLPEADMAQAVVLGYRATPQGFLVLPPDERGRLWLEALGIWLAWEGGRVVCFDEKNQPVVTRSGLKKEKQQAEAHSEEMARQAEEAILARRETEKRLADAEKQAADEARKRAEAEKRAADMAAQLAQLQALVKQMGGPT